jgi:hypothetical protein
MASRRGEDDRVWQFQAPFAPDRCGDIRDSGGKAQDLEQ